MRLVLLGRLLHPSKGFAFASALVVLATLGCSEGGETTPLEIFAAASLQGPLEEVIHHWTHATSTSVRAHYASSSTLARQIDLGATPDVVVSASAEWMNYLAEKGLVKPSTVRELAGNRLALLGKKSDFATYSGLTLSELFSQARCISIGDWDHVPAGRYGKEALVNLGVWEANRSKFIPAKDARAALGMMAEGACPLNLGYANLANLVSGIEVIAEISGDLHTPVVYLVAQVQGGENELVGHFGEYLVNSKSKAIFKSQGFLPPPNGAD